MVQTKVNECRDHAARNLVQWPGGTVTIGARYDVEGRMSRVTWDGNVVEQHLYDARSRRVKSGGTLQLYGLGGELLGEYLSAPAGLGRPLVMRERVYFAGQLVGTVEGYGSWSLPGTDRLGSLKHGSRRYPFGDGNESYANDEYATYRKDTASAHYYAWHRWYSATWGRFSSPDPYVMSGGLTNPQGWNRYSYVANDPVNFHDPTGLVAAATKFHDPTLACVLGMPFWLSYDYALVLCSGGGGWGGAGPVTYPSPGVERGGGGGPAGRDRFDKAAIFSGVEKLLAKGKCADFVIQLLQKGFLDVNKVFGPADLGQYERGIYDSLGTSVIVDVLQKAEFYDRGKAPLTQVGNETYTIVARANYRNDDTSSIDLFDPFFELSSTGQYQTVLHEAMHLVWNIGDENYARAVGIRGKSGPAASAAWHAKLKEKCK